MIFLQGSVALGQGSKKLVINALATLNGINLQDKATKLSTTQMENLLHMTSKKLKENNFQTQNCGHLEAHAQILALLETELALGEDNPVCFFEGIRLLKERIENKETLPSYLIMENVKNLLSSNQGRDFAEVIYQMDKVGYDIEWNVFDSAEVVPQHRERIYIIGHLRKGCIRQVFPIQRQGSDSSQSNGIRDVSNTLTTVQKDNLIGIVKTHKIKIIGNVSKTGHHSDDVMDEYGISKTITAQNAYKHTPKVAVHQIGNIVQTKSFGSNPQTGRVYDMDGLSPTLTTMQGGGLEPKILVKACLTPNRIKKRQNGRRFKRNGEPAFTLTAVDRNGVLIDDGTSIAIRKLTPLECWRLQGFTDEQFSRAKQAGISNSQLYKQAGNAVTVPVVKAIGQKLKENEVYND